MSPRPTPEELLAAFLEAHPTPSPAEVEALCAEHPDTPAQPTTAMTITVITRTAFIRMSSLRRGYSTGTRWTLRGRDLRERR